jgi:hypothetical protein
LAGGGGFGDTPTRIGLALPKRLRRLLLSQASRPASLRRPSTSTTSTLRLHGVKTMNWSGDDEEPGGDVEGGEDGED